MAIPQRAVQLRLGGMVRPLRRSRSRWPATWVSTETIRAWHPARSASRTSHSVTGHSEFTYSWNQSGPVELAAISAREVVAMVAAV